MLDHPLVKGQRYFLGIFKDVSWQEIEARAKKWLNRVAFEPSSDRTVFEEFLSRQDLQSVLNFLLKNSRDRAITSEEVWVQHLRTGLYGAASRSFWASYSAEPNCRYRSIVERLFTGSSQVVGTWRSAFRTTTASP
jgi:hypothetical protein